MPYSHEPRTSWVFFVSSANWTPIWARKNCCGAHLFPLRSCCERPSISFWRRAKLRHRSCAEKQIMQIPEKLLQYQVYQLLVVDKLEGLDVSSFPRSWIFFWVSWQVWLGHLQARYEGWILAHPTRSQSLGKKNILPKTGLWNPWRCCFWAQQGRLVASVQSPPETFAKKPIWLQCNRHTSRGLWKQPGPRMRVHNHLPIFWTNTDIISPKHCLRDLFRIYPIFRHIYSNML